ncbi:BSP-domain-containing protein [Ascobolus immersus RN42]|uniref:BSP-domain-containing protein n=1 Tax=Ascobolus immersus RN42 TaxID=1160509 RepID=A0A3N4IWA1_ASCIM|nr:BSP-domain-containing protein [Ascobolus immersus RN42]
MGFFHEKVSRIVSIVKDELSKQGVSSSSHQHSSDHRPPQPPFHSRPPQPQATPFPGSTRPTPHHPPPPNDPRSYQLTQTLYTPPPMATTASSPTAPCPYPFHLRIETLSHPAVALLFRALPHLPTLLPQLHTIITTLLYPHHPPPEVRSVTLFIRPMPGVAYTTGTRLDEAHKEIHLSADYILSCCHGSDPSTDAARRAEIEGVLLHELVHCLQFSKGCPGGLIEGIADFVRLRGGKGAKHWKREGGKKGDWCGGYSRTGYFLDWLEESYGPGTVAWVNESMREKKYSDEVFRDITGTGVHGLWKRYKRTYELEGRDDGSDDERDC